jgi:hypothetical protein
MRDLEKGTADARPLDCGDVSLDDDFRPFLGKHLLHLTGGTPNLWRYGVEGCPDCGDPSF